MSAADDEGTVKAPATGTAARRVARVPVRGATVTASVAVLRSCGPAHPPDSTVTATTCGPGRLNL